MSHPITVPSNDQTYSLVADLTVMAASITGHLDSLESYINKKTSSGASVSFDSIVCTGGGTFSQVTITGTNPGYLKNNQPGFGLVYGNTSFLSNGTKWISIGDIEVPSTPSGNNAISWNYLFGPSGVLNGAIDIIGDLPTDYIKRTEFNTSQSAQDTAITTAQNTADAKANQYGAVNKVRYASYADEAGAANSSTTAGLAGNSNRWANRSLRLGSLPSVTIKAGASTYGNIVFSPPFAQTPMVFAQATNDDGRASILCSTDAVTVNGARVNFRNINESYTETTHVVWMALGV